MTKEQALYVINQLYTEYCRLHEAMRQTSYDMGISKEQYSHVQEMVQSMCANKNDTYTDDEKIKHLQKILEFAYERYNAHAAIQICNENLITCALRLQQLREKRGASNEMIDPTTFKTAPVGLEGTNQNRSLLSLKGGIKYDS